MKGLHLLNRAVRGREPIFQPDEPNIKEHVRIHKLADKPPKQPQYGQMSVFIFSISSFSTRHSRTPSPRARCSVGAFPNAWPCVCAESPEEVVRLYLPQILGAARGAVSPPPLVDARHGHLAALLFE